MLYRIETDSLGEIEVPSNRYYGAQTARALIHFEIGSERMPTEIIRVFGLIKKVAAWTNFELGLFKANEISASEKINLISKAAVEVFEGKLDEHFPLTVWQSGSGTQTHMNVNEVIANRAIELARGKMGSKRPIHPNDDVNLSQSSNDTFPTVMHIAATQFLVHLLLPNLRELQIALTLKQKEFENVVKIGRTHLMDAVPVTLGQEFSGYVAQLDHATKVIESTLPGLYELAIGGTAVGTGLNCHPEFAKRVVSKIADEMKLPFVLALNRFAALSSHEPLANAMGALKILAIALMKISNDIRWMASGPRCGLNEVTLPENEPGSSIMPGKSNPTQCEVLAMVCTQVFGSDATIGLAASQGNFELNVFKPVIIYNFLQSTKLLSDCCHSFRVNCVQDTPSRPGIKPNIKQIKNYVSNSPMLVTALSPHIGYDKVAVVVKKAFQENITLKEAAVGLGEVTEQDFELWVNPLKMTHSQ